MRPSPFALDLKNARRTTLLFFLAVFLTFAPMMLLGIRVREPTSWTTIGLWMFISGGCGVLWAISGSIMPRLFPVAIAAQAVAAWSIAKPPLEILRLDPQGFAPLGLIAMFSIATGYACFVRFLNTQGARAIGLWTEMDLAKRIHAHLVPPVRVRFGVFDVAGRSQASGAMGGDLVDGVMHSDGTLEVLIADVSGHGVRAGVVMAMIKSLLAAERERTADGSSPLPLIESLESLNRVLSDLAEPGMFATMAIARVARNGAVQYALAGHPPIFLRRADRTMESLEIGSMPLAVVRNVEFEIGSATMRPGDVLALYSDGLVEVNTGPRGAGPQIGMKGIEMAIAGLPNDSADGQLAALFAAIKARSTDPEPLDDQSALLLRFAATPGG